MKDFFKKYGLKFLALMLLALAISYSWFVVPGIVPTGNSLDKSHWLAFWGSFLAFAGSLFLGLTAIWQNEQAEKTNQKIIDDNRRERQIQFENELKRNKCMLILDGVHHISQRVSEILQRANATRAHLPEDAAFTFFESIKIEITVLYTLEIDNFLPPCYEEDFPELTTYKEALKNSLKLSADMIEKELKTIVLGNTPLLKIRIDKKTLLELNSHFHKILNSASTYLPFDEEGSDDFKPTT